MVDLQRPDGSWGWFTGMTGNLSTTLDVLTRAARLQRMTGMAMLPTQSIERASHWTDRYMEQALSRLSREALQSLTPSRTQLLYLYVQSLLGRTESQAFSTLLKRVEATANEPHPVDRKALIACILELNRRPATTLLQSMEELTVCTPEMGRYFDSRRAPLSMESYRIGTQTAAIETFSMQAEKYAGVIRQMQQWLIQSRRTQGWTRGTTAAEAVYALLLHTDSADGSPRPACALHPHLSGTDRGPQRRLGRRIAHAGLRASGLRTAEGRPPDGQHHHGPARMGRRVRAAHPPG